MCVAEFVLYGWDRNKRANGNSLGAWLVSELQGLMANLGQHALANLGGDSAAYMREGAQTTSAPPDHAIDDDCFDAFVAPVADLHAGRIFRRRPFFRWQCYRRWTRALVARSAWSSSHTCVRRRPFLPTQLTRSHTGPGSCADRRVNE